MRARLDSSTPQKALVAPRRPRKLLVNDIQMCNEAATVPHQNYLIDQMAKHTGAFGPTFSNDIDLLKYPRIKDFATERASGAALSCSPFASSALR
jgi:hypothetical protein